jgi:hypothetical protein
MKWVRPRLSAQFMIPLIDVLTKNSSTFLGMGKTLQTIATIMDNRPKLQHCKPGTKHPFSDDLKEREEEDMKWQKASDDWKYEMDILKVMKKIRSRDGGGRAGESIEQYYGASMSAFVDANNLSFHTIQMKIQGRW